MPRILVVLTCLGLAAAAPTNAAGSAVKGPRPQDSAVMAYQTSPGAPDPSRVAVRGVFELTLAWDLGTAGPEVANDVDFSLQLTGPAGATDVVGGFYETSLPGGPSLWQARYAPALPGRWRYTYQLARRSTGETASGAGTFTAVDQGLPGFLRRNPANPFRFAFENGTPFAPIGFNDCLGVRSSLQMDGGDRFGAFNGGIQAEQYFAAYAEAGFNLFRFSPSNCSPDLAGGDLGTINPDVALYFDWLFARLRAAGFRVMYGIGGYRIPDDPATPLTPEARRYLEYAVDRWGAFVDIWELQNERRASAEWIAEAAGVVRARDPYHHPLTTSWERPELEAIDVNAPHWYESENELESDHVTASRAAGWKQAGKPVLVGEQGNSARPDYGWGNWLPDSAVRMRLRTWTAFFEEIGLVFWNNSWATNGSGGGASNLYIGPQERLYVRVLTAAVGLADRPDLVIPARPVAEGLDPTAVRAYGIVSADGGAVYFHHYANHESPLIGQQMTIDVPQAGRGIWFDPATGAILGSSPVSAGRQSLSVPPFVVDLAFVTVAADTKAPPLALADLTNPQADGDLDNDGQPDRGPMTLPFGAAPLTLTLDASKAFDPDGGPVTATWSFGDGAPAAAGPVVQHSYAKGNYFTTLTVTDDEGRTGRASWMVRATADVNPDVNDPPMLDVLAPVTAREGELIVASPIAIDRELTGGSYRREAHAQENVELHAGELPPGARFEAPAGGGPPQLWWVPSFDQAGTYEVDITARDAEGAESAPQALRITVTDVAPDQPVGPRVYLPMCYR